MSSQDEGVGLDAQNVRFFFVIILVFIMLSVASAQPGGVRKKKPLPQNYGNIKMNSLSEKSGMAPVVFRHWLHRAKYTCRLCHVEFGFAMSAGKTVLKEGATLEDHHCGQCHNGKEAFATVTKSPSGEEVTNCERCHSYGEDVKFAFDFFRYTEKFPREYLGDGIDWTKAEAQGIIKLQDKVPASLNKKEPQDAQEDFFIESKSKGLPPSVFSHKKHIVWSSCDQCHTDMFNYEKGSTKYTMDDIFEGRYCGQCHGKVAFPNEDCQRCHIVPVDAKKKQ